jgi:hypothetical protein
MLSRPTTEQILLDCRTELLNTIDPAVSDPAVKIAIQMMENVLRNCATRSAHEIAWMADEIERMVAYAEHVAASAQDRDSVRGALDRCKSQRSSSLHLDDVAHDYHLASACLSAALDTAMAEGNASLAAEGRAIIDQRVATELQIMGEWSFVGRG